MDRPITAKHNSQASGRQIAGSWNRLFLAFTVVWSSLAAGAVLSAGRLLEDACRVSTMRFLLRDKVRAYLKSVTMRRIRGTERRVERLPMITSSWERRRRPRVNRVVSAVVVGVVPVYHMAFVNMHKKREAKQQATRWHLLSKIIAVINHD
jgi:hypothetical protein